jgi:hypothetical protein
MSYYTVGDYLLGEDMDDQLMGAYLIGAARARGGRAPARVAPRGAASQAMAIKQAAESTLVKSEPPTRANEYPVGFDSSTTVAAAASTNITSRPQRVFRPERLVIPSAIAPQFLITDFKVGNSSQFLNSVAIPAEVFDARAVGVRLKCETAQINSDLVLGVTNISLAALRFFGAAIGTALS